MKKNYSKPDILFESFSLCSSIAAGCARPIRTQAEMQCALMAGNRAIFTDAVNACMFKVMDGSAQFDGICYHIPTEYTNLFNS